jgi:16S rRNA (uracil1498-N3)-methyltransferase
VRITRLYHPGILNCGETIQLDINASNHLIRVLRAEIETSVILFNGNGFDYCCKTLNDNPKKTLITIETKTNNNIESNLNITLIQGLSRTDRMETTIQKCVELGINRIIPVICQRSNTKLRKDKQIKKLEHWRKVAISACEQSGRSIIPEVTEITPLNNITSLLQTEASKFILNPDTETSLKDVNYNQQAIEVFIGPEGGLNNEEINFLNGNNFLNIRFGPRILRTETAGPAVVSALQMIWGDF